MNSVPTTFLQWTRVWTIIILAGIAHMLPCITIACMAVAHAEREWKALIVFSIAHLFGWACIWFCHKKLK